MSNDDSEVKGEQKASDRPTIQMWGNPAAAAPPPEEHDDGADEIDVEDVNSTDGESSLVSSDGSPLVSADQIWLMPNSDAPSNPDESNAEATFAEVEALTKPTTLDLDSAIEAARQWGIDNGVSSDPYLTELVSDLTNRKRLTYWASIDPLEHLPEPQTKFGKTLKLISRVTILLRNVAVFVPVALTWLAINKATDAFGAYAQTKPGEQVNFLQFWQSGGDTGEFLDRFWRIQHVAFLDAMIIAFIILATLLSGALETNASRRQSLQQREADAKRTALALTIGRSLHGNRTASPESISEALALALADLSEAARNVVTATNRLENSTSAIDALKPRLETLNQQIASLNKNFATDVVNSVANLSTSVGTLGTTLGGDMNRFLSDVLAGIEEMNEYFATTVKIVDLGTKQLKDDLEAIHQRLAQVAGRRP